MFVGAMTFAAGLVVSGAGVSADADLRSQQAPTQVAAQSMSDLTPIASTVPIASTPLQRIEEPAAATTTVGAVVPTPGAAVLMGAAGLALLRARRRDR
jgi:hypothetical protein